MNRYTLSQLDPGVSESFTVTVTDDMMAQFVAVCGDINPLHNSDTFAKRRGYKGRVVFGMLSASLFSTLAGVYLPGENCLLQELHTKFRRPVFVGDRLTVSGFVSEKSEALGRITIKAQIVNQDGEKVNSAVIQAGVLKGDDDER